MREHRPTYRRWMGVCAICLLLSALFVSRSAANLDLEVIPASGGGVEISHSFEPGFYYIVYRSVLPGQGEVPVAVWISPVDGHLVPAFDRCFFRVCQIPTDSPWDTDEDGIDDVFELGTPVLDPTDGGDGQLDPDGDGVDSLTEYRQGRNPGMPALPDVGGEVNLDVYTPLDPA